MKKRMAVYLIFGLMAALAFAACGSSSSSVIYPPPAVPLVLGDVQTLYNTTSGASWNDYVKGGNIMSATDTPCNAATDTACVHAAEIRVVEVTGTDSCAGVTATDSLGAFNWICDDSADPVVLISNGLASGSGLQDLIDFTALTWKEISVTVYRNGTQEDITNSTTWWDNAVVANTTGGDLSDEGTVYVIANSEDGIAYNLIANRVSLVAGSGVIINGPVNGTDSYVINATSRDFVWMEGMVINATGDDAGIHWDTVRFSALRNLTSDYADTGSYMSGVRVISSTNNRLTGINANNNGDYGIRLDTSSDNILMDITANDEYYGVYLNASTDNTLSGVTANNNVNDGVSLVSSSDNNALTDVTASNNSGVGVYLISSSNNTLSGMSTSNNSVVGIFIQSSSNNTLSGITTSNNLNEGLLVATSSKDNTFSVITASNNGNEGISIKASSDNSTLSGITASNNGFSGIYLESSSNNTLSGITASNNGSYGIELGTSSDNFFTGLLKVGNNVTGNCAEVGGTNPGIVDGTCKEAGLTGTYDYGLGNTSDALLTNSVIVNASSFFIANITSGDTVNTSDTANGTALFDDIMDWAGFQNPYRAWGAYSADDYPSANHQSACATGETCQIWDWSALASDAVIVNSLSYPGTGDIANSLTHVWSGTPGTNDNAGCNAMVTGSVWNGTDSVCETTFLRNSMEIMGDGAGNENTLCESGETCLYTPNMGSYQGHGAIVNSPVAFTDGAVLTGITLMQFETNGR